jgi:hypothetical protein
MARAAKTRDSNRHDCISPQSVFELCVLAWVVAAVIFVASDWLCRKHKGITGILALIGCATVFAPACLYAIVLTLVCIGIVPVGLS